jgi:hypothetical protein
LSCVTIPDSFGRKEGRRREGSLEDFLLVDIPSRPGESSKGYRLLLSPPEIIARVKSQF